MDNPPSPTAIPHRTSSARFGHQSPKNPTARTASDKTWLSNGSSSSKTPTRQSHHTKSFSLPENHVADESVGHKHGHVQDQARRGRRRGIGEDLIFQSRSTWSAQKEKVVMGPYDYLEGHPGKDIRSQLIAAFNAWLNVPRESLDVITKVVGMLHTSSLLVDDVEDFSLLRRGVPVAHSIFGTAQTINSANYVYFQALQELQKLNNPRAIIIFTEELLNLHRGQGMDLFWRDTLTCPSEDDYLEMVHNKTGGLFRLAIKLMQTESSSATDCVPIVNTIGLLFQILDDYKNLSSTQYAANKGMAEDLTEGKFSFPIIHAIRSGRKAASNSIPIPPGTKTFLLSSPTSPHHHAGSIPPFPSPPSSVAPSPHQVSNGSTPPPSSQSPRMATATTTNSSPDDIPQDLVLINILRQRTSDDEVKRYAIAYMERLGSFEYTRAVMKELNDRAFALLDSMEASEQETDPQADLPDLAESRADGRVGEPPVSKSNGNRKEKGRRRRVGDGVRAILDMMKVEEAEDTTLFTP